MSSGKYLEQDECIQRQFGRRTTRNSVPLLHLTLEVAEPGDTLDAKYLRALGTSQKEGKGRRRVENGRWEYQEGLGHFFMHHPRSRDSAVGIVTGYGLDGRRVKNFLFFSSTRRALGSTQSPIQWVRGLSPRG
jgi:hypothetical protein